MKKILPYLLTILFFLSAKAQSSNLNFDSTLAKSLGADDYGMSKYILVILKTGSHQSSDKKYLDSCFSGHFTNIEHMTKIGKLIVAGPISSNEKEYRGIFILKVNDFNEAMLLLKKDPTVNENILEPELYEWYGSAALPVFIETADKIWKFKP